MRHLIATLSATAALTSPAFAGEVWLTMDYVQPYVIERPAGKIIIGNPGIADVQVQDSTSVLLFGKGPGTTNMYILDENGEKIDDLIVRVRARGDNALTMQRGVERTTYNCMTACEQTVTVGDSGAAFGQTASQIQQKYQQATATSSE